MRLARSSHFLQALFSLCLLQVTTAQDDAIKSVPLRTHSLAQPYLDSELQSRWFDWGGDTIIRTDQYVRLTSDRQHQAGYLWSRLPLTATNWEIEVEFKIHGHGTLFGDGMAMWITRQRASPGPVFGSVDKFEGLGLFIDTYKNERPGVIFPYISAMIGDGKTSYDHAHDGKATELAGCSARGIRGSTVPTKARLTYFQEKYLKLELQYKAVDQWVECFKADNVALPPVAYLGFSADCGELSENHDIISVDAKNLYLSSKPGPGKSSKQTGPGKSTKSWSNHNSTAKGKQGGWGWFILKFIIFGIVCAGGYVGWVAYRSQRRNSRF